MTAEMVAERVSIVNNKHKYLFYHWTEHAQRVVEIEKLKLV